MDKKQLEQELSKFDNLADMLHFLSKKFDLTIKLGFVSKPAIIAGLVKAYQLLNPPIKK